MSRSGDRDLGMHRNIARRDFVNGVGVAVTGSLFAPKWLSALDGWPDRPPGAQEYYPPARTGMRGSHAGSFEVAHQLRDGITWNDAADTRESYDLVVVGGGLSGLSAAYFFLTSAGPGARVLVLDNHDDFGGHAKRNEFTYGGRTLLLNGGTSNLESVNHYSTVSRTLLAAIGLDLDRAQAASAGSREFYRSLGLGSATFFAKEVFGEDRLVMGRPGRRAVIDWDDWLARTPLSTDARMDIARLNDDSANPDHMPGLPDWEKKERLARMSYRDFLLEVAKVHPDVIPFYDDGPKGLFCVGIDAYPALYAWAEGYPGFQGMNLERFSPVGPLAHIGGGQHGRENEWGGGPTIDLPDGERDAGPAAGPGHDPRRASRVDARRLDHVTPRVRQARPGRLRRPHSTQQHGRIRPPPGRSRLGPPGRDHLRARGTGPRRSGPTNCVMACYNRVIPHLVPEMPEAQRTALMYGVKMPIVYTSVLIRNWTAFTNLGHLQGERSGDVPSRRQPGPVGEAGRLPPLPIARRADGPAHGRGRPVLPVIRRRSSTASEGRISWPRPSRPSSAGSGTSSGVCSRREASTRRATSRRSP